ncbi:hypothetical protein [Bradyrhizobium japonicum]|uniref:hypothetical protein n=1 Tax=Bradyrhizobium japonicum TaxID=375 RepID=UPI0004B9A0AF|nr:hypothetical protein [Bradyrhizobium japonicum]
MTEPIEIEPLILCPTCKVEMRLFGIEMESPLRDLFSFECPNCGKILARSLLVALPSEPKISH